MGDAEEKLVDKKVGKKVIRRRLKVFLSHFRLFFTLVIYIGIGAMVFQKLEGPHEISRKTHLKYLLEDGRTNFIQTVLNSSLDPDELNSTFTMALDNYNKIIDQVTSRGMSVLKPEVKSDWDYVHSAFFASTVLTTIGYGNMVPKTFWGRLFCIGFALIGIPLTLTVIADLGKVMASGVSSSYKSFRTHFHYEIIKSSSKLNKFSGKSARMLMAVFSLLLYISAGGYCFTLWENWSFLDSFYFCFITMTTIGFGDFVPDQETYMLLCTIYIMFGLALTSTAIELVRGHYADSWKKVREISSRLHVLSGPLAESIKKMGGNMMMGNLMMGGMMIGMGGNMVEGAKPLNGGVNLNQDMKILKELNELKKALAENSREMKREGGVWKRFWENDDDFDISMMESHDPPRIQIFIYESAV